MIVHNRPISTWLVCSAVIAATLTGCSGDDDLGPSEPADNRPPTIDAITSSPETVYPDSLVTLTVEASDPNGDRLTYLWSADAGTFVGETTGTTVTWQAPGDVRAYDVQVVVSDGWRNAEGSRIVTISEPPNRAPSTRVTRMFVSNRDGFNEIPDFVNQTPMLRDSSLVTLFFEGTDPDGFVTGYRYRIIRRDIVRQSILAYPYGDFFAADSVTTPGMSEPFFPSYPFMSNDYYLVIQSRDDDGAVDAHPDSVFFQVNFPPTFDPEQVYPGPEEAVAWTSQETMTVRFRADDIETPTTRMTYRVVFDGVWGARVGPVDDVEDLRQAWPMPEPGTHVIEYVVEDPGLREGRLTVTFRVVI